MGNCWSKRYKRRCVVYVGTLSEVHVMWVHLLHYFSTVVVVLYHINIDLIQT